MRYWLLLLTACSGIKFVWPDFRVAQTPPPEQALGMNALQLTGIDTLTYQVDGNKVSAVLNKYRRIKIYTQDGERSAEVKMPFSARMQLAGFDGRTRIGDGMGRERIIKAPLDEIVVKRPWSEQGIRDVGEASFKMAGITPGCVVEYFVQYDIPDALLIDPILLRDNIPSERSELLIIAPKNVDLELRYLVGGVTVNTNPPVPAVPPDPKEQVAYRFVLEKQTPLIIEEYGPSAARVGPAVWPIFKGIKSAKGNGPRNERWEDVGAYVKNKYSLSPVTGTDTDQDKTQTAFMSETLKMHIVDTGLRLGEREGRNEHDRIGAGFALFDAMAARGFKIGLGLVAREQAGLLLPEVPSASMFDAVVVAMPVNGKTIFFDPDCPSCPVEQVSSGLEGAPVVTLFNDTVKLETLPSREPKDNAYSITLSSKVGQRGETSGSAQIVLSGSPASTTRAAYLRKEGKQLQKELGFLEGLEISNIQAPGSGAQPTLTYEMTFDFKTMCKEEPGAKLRCGVGNVLDKVLPELWREARTQDLIVPTSFQHQVVASYQIPAKAAVDVPQPMQVKNKFGEYSLAYQANPGQLAMSRRFVLTARRVPVDDYDDFYKFLQQVRQYDTVMPLIDLFPPEDVKPAGATPAKEEKKGKKKGKKKH